MFLLLTQLPRYHEAIAIKEEKKVITYWINFILF